VRRDAHAEPDAGDGDEVVRQVAVQVEVGDDPAAEPEGLGEEDQRQLGAPALVVDDDLVGDGRLDLD